jgi:hypothetical protein
MHHRPLLVMGAMTAASVAVLAPIHNASAHAVIIAGTYHVAMGWEFEPAGGTVTYVGQPNGVQVFVDTLTRSGAIGSPVSNLNSDCSRPDFQVTVTFAGTTSSPLCPRPTFDSDTGLGRPDEYDAVLTPTKVGDYAFHIFGSIHGVAIDKTVTSGPSTFDTVGDQSAVDFPTAAPALSDVATKVDQVGNRASDALASAQNAVTAANDAASAANRASVLAVVAIVVAALLSVANLALAARRRRN